MNYSSTILSTLNLLAWKNQATTGNLHLLGPSKVFHRNGKLAKHIDDIWFRQYLVDIKPIPYLHFVPDFAARPHAMGIKLFGVISQFWQIISFSYLLLWLAFIAALIFLNARFLPQDLYGVLYIVFTEVQKVEGPLFRVVLLFFREKAFNKPQISLGVELKKRQC